MTNKERQKSLDKKKWIASEKKKLDYSGLMDYCRYCMHKDWVQCTAPQQEREALCLCARAYNRMKRSEAWNQKQHH